MMLVACKLQIQSSHVYWSWMGGRDAVSYVHDASTSVECDVHGVHEMASYSMERMKMLLMIHRSMSVYEKLPVLICLQLLVMVKCESQLKLESHCLALVRSTESTMISKSELVVNYCLHICYCSRASVTCASSLMLLLLLLLLLLLHCCLQSRAPGRPSMYTRCYDWSHISELFDLVTLMMIQSNSPGHHLAPYCRKAWRCFSSTQLQLLLDVTN